MNDIKELLDKKFIEFNKKEFIKTDPIQIPKMFKLKEDIEISAFLAATIAWGNRKMIINNALKLIKLMHESPYDFVINHKDIDLKPLQYFTHRTFNGIDCIFFIKSLQNIYKNYGGLQYVFEKGYQDYGNIKNSIKYFREVFLELPHEKRTEKHIANVDKKSAAKRINMFLRWMVRNDNFGVDFGLWKGINSADLMMPLDVHSGNVSRKLGLLNRKQNDWTAVEELTLNLKKFDAKDPVKYDFALFGLGVFDKFK